MKNNLILIALVLLITAACTREVENCTEEPLTETSETGAYDEALAKELGADAYGMKYYVMALLKEGPNRNQDSTTAAELQRAHLDNIKRLADERKLVVAGPFMDATDLRGIYIFDAETIEEAQKLVATDPAIKAGRLVMELHPWYGSAALMKSAEIHGTLSKKNI